MMARCIATMYLKGVNKMKRILAVILIIVSFSCLFSCGGNTFNKAVSQLEDYGLEKFNYDYKQINQVKKDIKAFGINIEGDIEKITHLLKEENGALTYAYVYEFENSAEATLFYNSYAKNSISRLKGNVVIFGNLQMINSIKL